MTMTAYIAPAEEHGRARFRPTDDLLAEAETFRGAPYSMAEVLATIARAGPIWYEIDGEQRRLSATARLVLMDLATYVSANKWEQGQAFAWPSNETIAAHVGRDVRTVQTALEQLEAAGLIIRRYDYRNERIAKAGLDLRPLGLRLAQWAAAIADAEAERAAARAMRRQERAETLRQVTSWDHEENATQDYKNKNPLPEKSTPDRGYVDEVEAEAAVNRPYGRAADQYESRFAAVRTALRADAWQERGSPPPLAVLEALSNPDTIALLLRCSPAFRRRMTEKTHPFPPENATLTEITAVLDEIRHAIRFNQPQWERGLRRHGIDAVYALLVAMDRDNIQSRAGFLANILKKSPQAEDFNPLKSLKAMKLH